MALIGRDAELERARRAVDAVLDGDPRTTGIFGDAGIGKSAVLAELAALAADAGFEVLQGIGAEHERDVPFGLVVDALDDRVAAMAPRRREELGPLLGAVLPSAGPHEPGLPDELAGPAQRFRYHRALRTLLETLAREQPLALILDDVHWADAASAEFVLHLLRRPVRSPLLLVVALRPVDPMPRILDAARSLTGWEALWLEPLTHDAALEVLAAVPDPRLRNEIAREAAGNPLYLQELARGAGRDGALPPTLLAAVDLELAALSPAARGMIDGAAVAGDPFDPELAAAAADLTGVELHAQLDRVVAAGLVQPTGDRRTFRFRHPLVRRAVYDCAPAGWRLGAHERAADCLASRGASASQRAFHVEQAAQPGDEAAVRLLAEAAAEAGDTAPASAARWYGAALGLLPAGDLPQRTRLCAERGRALATAGRLDAARDALTEALASDAHDPAERIALLRDLALVERSLGHQVDSQARLEQALAEAPADQKAALSLELISSAWHGGDHDRMRRWSEQTMEVAGDDEVIRAGAEACAALLAQWAGESERALGLLDRAERRLADADADSDQIEVSLFYLATAQLMMDRHAAAEATSTRAVERARAAKRDDLVLWFGLTAASASAWRLDLDTAASYLDLCEDMAHSLDIRAQLTWILWTRAWVADIRGDHAERTRATREFEEIARDVEEMLYIRAGRRWLALLDAETDPERSIEEILSLSAGEPEKVSPTTSTTTLLTLTRCALAAGRIDDASQWAERCTAHAEELALPVGNVRAACARAEVMLARGDEQRAVELARSAVDRARELGARLDETVARVVLGRALAAAGDPSAEEVLQSVASDAADAGALRLHAQAARELRRIGVHVKERSRRAAASASALTERERTIADLVAAGRTNKEVSQALYLSEKTVERHLSRVYAKLSIRSRYELAAALDAA